MCQNNVVQKINTHILCLITFSPKIMPFLHNVEKYGRAGQATADNMTHSHCMLDTKDYKYTHTICNRFCFSTGKLVARRHLNDTLYVRYLPCVLLVMSESF